MIIEAISERNPTPIECCKSLSVGRGMLGNLSDRDRASRDFMNNLELKVLRDTNIVSISFEAKKLKLAKEAVDKLIGFYLNQYTPLHSATSQKSAGLRRGECG